MRTLVLILIAIFLLIIPFAAFPDVAIGGAAFKNTADFENTSLFENLLFGANGRFRFGTLQLDTVGLYNSGSSAAVDLILDAEGNFDFFCMNISGGVGPNFYILTGNTNSFTYGINARVNVDVRIFRKLTFGLSYIYLIDDIAQKQGASSSRSLIGATVLIW